MYAVSRDTNEQLQRKMAASEKNLERDSITAPISEAAAVLSRPVRVAVEPVESGVTYYSKGPGNGKGTMNEEDNFVG